MKELSRFELAIIKRTAQNTKRLRKKRDKILAKQEEQNKELAILNQTIAEFEQPIVTMTEGFTSEEVLDGTMEFVQSQGFNSVEEMEFSKVKFEEAQEEKMNGTESPQKDEEKLQQDYEASNVEDLDEIIDGTTEEGDKY